ncbi:hypothetical protein BV22DRAFT_1040174 [Leucogyrophana mollusca]|uniref:Uncharacterized protein n=1 Tax=Leucogyrophana mollusca TaxID=85980 RepID=A0ACB8B431_9AGAM|nr:hypothetical protein BV22DRAFT_1040174 [Leucogyrophana mollusca]
MDNVMLCANHEIIDFNSIWIHRHEVSKHVASCRKSYVQHVTDRLPSVHKVQEGDYYLTPNNHPTVVSSLSAQPSKELASSC